MTSHSISSLVTQLSYSELSREGIIPDLLQVTPKLDSKRYPSWVYRLNRSGYKQIFTCFDHLLREIVQWAASREDEPDPHLLWKKVSDISISQDDLDKSQKLFQGIVSTFRSAFAGRRVELDPKLILETIEGKPDLMGEGWALDIKTTTNFLKIAEGSLLQVLAYKALKENVNFIGVLLPLQEQIVWYDLSGWKPSAYRNILLRESKWLSHDLQLEDTGYFLSNIPEDATIQPNVWGGMGCTFFSPFLGRHIPRDYPFPSSVPFQIFLSPPQAHASPSIEGIKEKLTQEHKLFVHAPYIINLCSTEAWSLERLRQELIAARQIGSRGIVVHVGKYKKLSYERGLEIMEQRIRSLLDETSPECPILLETPAGEGTELCANISAMMRFYARFEGHPGIKICVDTCHVWGSGYEPGYYLRCWLKRFPGTVGLVHFNDSRRERGSRKDVHFCPGLGYIGYFRLWEVHELCRKEGIPMIIE